jgi:hypothetical protein
LLEEMDLYPGDTKNKETVAKKVKEATVITRLMIRLASCALWRGHAERKVTTTGSLSIDCFYCAELLAAVGDR